MPTSMESEVGTGGGTAGTVWGILVGTLLGTLVGTDAGAVDVTFTSVVVNTVGIVGGTHVGTDIGTVNVIFTIVGILVGVVIFSIAAIVVAVTVFGTGVGTVDTLISHSLLLSLLWSLLLLPSSILSQTSLLPMLHCNGKCKETTSFCIVHVIIAACF